MSNNVHPIFQQLLQQLIQPQQVNTLGIEIDIKPNTDSEEETTTFTVDQHPVWTISDKDGQS